MTERIREIGGTLEINSSAIGTEIVARVPSTLKETRNKFLRPECKR